MAQEAVGGATTPEGGIFRAWLEVAIHPKFATFQRWYPLMRFRWRVLSLVVALLLVFAAGFVYIAHGAMFAANYSLHALSLTTFRDYLFSPHGVFEWFRFCFAAIVIVFGMPALCAAIGYRPIGPYRVRFHVAFGTWMQALPAISFLLLISACANFILGFFASSSFTSTVARYVFVYAPIFTAYGFSAEALASGSGQRVKAIWYITQVVLLVIALLLWYVGGNIPASLGHPMP